MKNALEKMFDDLVAVDRDLGLPSSPPPVERRRAMHGMGSHPGVVLETGSVVLLGILVETTTSIRSLTVVHRGVSHHFSAHGKTDVASLDPLDPNGRRFVLEAGDRIECERAPASAIVAIEVEASADARFSGWGS